MIKKLKSLLGDCSGWVRVTFAAKMLKWHDIYNWLTVWCFNTLLFDALVDTIHIIQVFHKSLVGPWNILDQPILWALKCFSWDTDISIRMDFWHTKRFYQNLVGDLLNWVVHLFFLIQGLQLTVSFMDDQEYEAVWPLFLCISSCNCIEINHYIQLFGFKCLINSTLHTLITYLYYMDMRWLDQVFVVSNHYLT